MILYDYLDSGNGYKVRLLLAQLARPYRWVELDIMGGRRAGRPFSPRIRTGAPAAAYSPFAVTSKRSGSLHGSWLLATAASKRTIVALSRSPSSTKRR
jgi:hypothetical protein